MLLWNHVLSCLGIMWRAGTWCQIHSLACDSCVLSPFDRSGLALHGNAALVQRSPGYVFLENNLKREIFGWLTAIHLSGWCKSSVPIGCLITRWKVHSIHEAGPLIRTSTQSAVRSSPPSHWGRIYRHWKGGPGPVHTALKGPHVTGSLLIGDAGFIFFRRWRVHVSRILTVDP